MRRPIQKERTVELERKHFVLRLDYWWPFDWLMKLTCLVWGHEDIWDYKYAPNMERCRFCGKDMSWGR